MSLLYHFLNFCKTIYLIYLLKRATLEKNIFQYFPQYDNVNCKNPLLNIVICQSIPKNEEMKASNNLIEYINKYFLVFKFNYNLFLIIQFLFRFSYRKEF